MRAVAILVALFLSLSRPFVQAGCNVRSVQTATADAQTAAVNAVTSAFAQCTQCPCQIKVRSEAKVVAEASANALRKENTEKRAGNCNVGSAQAAGSAGDASGDISTAISNAISQACGGNQAVSEADAIKIGLQSAAANVDAASTAASGGGATETEATSQIAGPLENTLADSLSTAVSKCKCSGDCNLATQGNGVKAAAKD